MILGHETFESWAALSTAKWFMNIVVYVDESGTHDSTGKLPGSGAVTISGLVATKEDWTAFDVRWRKVLKKYKACHFHFREQFAAWRVIALGKEPDSGFKKNPYKKWSKTKLHDFVIELAPLAASKLIVGGYVHTKLYNEDKIAGMPDRERHPYELCLDHFFNSYFTTIKNKRRPWLGQSVSFLFDWTEDEEWQKTVAARCEFFGKQKIKRISEYGFRKMKVHTPLQAADMVAYRVRFNMDRLSNYEFGTNWPELDDILFKEMNEGYKKMSQDEKDAALRKAFIIPENATYEQAMDAIVEKIKFKK
jgi:hypothetical protein